MNKNMSVYVSGYTTDKSIGIYQYNFDSSTGVLTPKGLAAEALHPSYFCLHKSNQHMYVVNEITGFQGQETGSVSSYTRNKETGELRLINQQPSGGEDPCYVTCDATGNYILVANYTSGTTSVFPIISPGSPESSIGEAVSISNHADLYQPSGGVPARQEGPHVHSIDLDPITQHYAFANDLGCDVLATYKFDRQHTGKLTLHSTFEFPKGSGPRHLKFAPNHNNFCYLVTELSNDVYMLEFDSYEGKFRKIQQIYALPEGEKENLGSEIDITPNGKFLYVSMRGYDLITIFEIDERTGKLSLVGHQDTGGKHPRHFTIDPTGSYLLVGNKDSDNIVVFKINQKTGTLTQVSSIKHVQPTCIQFWE
ncbi:Lactonase, 7-bladed beta-propeller-domain-containing protein [Cokeromyces recurvatus]|uniref:Lactonase, 7-bladed beta-propeller-domain-containing protein n=1 Tax=Cokeromyces recurvatus TaxID=90255 RepID=UPI00221F849F|nr:Lactonase, 7-bladed beta-propeller-domain-containing protein [Cokeromyces recurvatus]KAI7906788.1 Lactonase, 7-bladed beta-propeller-domain-containing protein [Cokeromyces recurvatus]